MYVYIRIKELSLSLFLRFSLYNLQSIFEMIETYVALYNVKYVDLAKTNALSLPIYCVLNYSLPSFC